MKSLFAILAMALAVLLSSCDGDSSTSSNLSASPVGTWSDSVSYTKTVLTIGADGSYVRLVTTSAMGASSYQKLSGTWSSLGDSLSVTLTKSEYSTDGTNWTATTLPTTGTTKAAYQVAGTILTISLQGVVTRYVQGTSGVVPAEVISAPAISPDGGTFTSAQTVTITSSNLGAVIYYTLDGTTPDQYSSMYTSALTVSTSKVVKAIAIKSGKSSAVSTATFTIQAGTGTGSIPAAFYGVWVSSEAGYSETMTTKTDGSVTIVDVDSAATGSDKYLRISGTFTGTSSTLTAVFTKVEGSADGKTWTILSTASMTYNETYTLVGKTLTITDAEGSTIYTKS